jgi:simple sugar transport system permease protein
VSDAALLLAASTLALAAPLLFAALGELIHERAGIVNIGIEGLMLIGAFAGMVGCHFSQSPLAGLAAACVASVAAGAVFGAWVIRLDASQIVAGAALNILALGATGVAYRALFGTTGAALTVPTFAPLAVGGDAVAFAPLRQNVLVYLALGLVPLVWLVLFRTHVGLRLRAVGEAPEAAASLGIDVDRVRWGAVLMGALLAGLGGAYLSLAYSNTFAEGMSAGRGFIALAIVVFGRWRPLGVLVGALLFGVATALQFQLQARGVAVPYHLVLMLPYLLTLAVLAVASGTLLAPAALGRQRTGTEP